MVLSLTSEVAKASLPNDEKFRIEPSTDERFNRFLMTQIMWLKLISQVLEYGEQACESV